MLSVLGCRFHNKHPSLLVLILSLHHVDMDSVSETFQRYMLSPASGSKVSECPCTHTCKFWSNRPRRRGPIGLVPISEPTQTVLNPEDEAAYIFETSATLPTSLWCKDPRATTTINHSGSLKSVILSQKFSDYFFFILFFCS
jgi:hypothetical protein